MLIKIVNFVFFFKNNFQILDFFFIKNFEKNKFLYLNSDFFGSFSNRSLFCKDDSLFLINFISFGIWCSIKLVADSNF